MKTFKIIAVSMLVLPIMAFAQNATTTLPDPGLTPDSPFYFLNRVGEALQEFFTFNPEAKARLELQFAAERISEIKAMLSAKGVTVPGIEVAKARLAENLAKASDAVIKVKTSGKDVTELAKEVSDRITSQKLALRGVFNEEGNKLSELEKSVKEKIKEADGSGDVEKAKEFVKELDVVSKEKETLKKHEDDSLGDLDEEDDRADSVLELKDQAQSAIDDAKKERAELLIEIPELTAADLALADKAIASAEDLFVKENFQASKELAHQAEKALERAKETAEKKAEGDKKAEELIKKYQEVQAESEKQQQEIDQETAKKLEEINSENEKKQLELSNEINKLSEDLKNSTSTED